MVERDCIRIKAPPQAAPDPKAGLRTRLDGIRKRAGMEWGGFAEWATVILERPLDVPDLGELTDAEAARLDVAQTEMQVKVEKLTEVDE